MVIRFYSLGMPEFNDRLFHLICKPKSYKFNKPPPQRRPVNSVSTIRLLVKTIALPSDFN